jgi:hypothetical protein
LTKDEEDRAIYVVALQSRGGSSCLCSALDRAWPVDAGPCFDELLAAIDEAAGTSPGRGEALICEPIEVMVPNTVPR